MTSISIFLGGVRTSDNVIFETYLVDERLSVILFVCIAFASKLKNLPKSPEAHHCDESDDVMMIDWPGLADT